jgi:hypothetical protein
MRRTPILSLRRRPAGQPSMSVIHLTMASNRTMTATGKLEQKLERRLEGVRYITPLIGEGQARGAAHRSSRCSDASGRRIWQTHLASVSE